MENQQDFTCGSILPKLARFMLPILGALILQAMYSAVDLLIVGKFGTVPDISGVSTGSSIMNMVTFTVSAFATGVTVRIGTYIGEKREENIGPLIGGAVFFFLIVGFAVSALLVIFARPIARLMQAPPEALDRTVTYIRICGAGYVFIVFYNFISSIFRGMGNSRLPLLFVAIACVTNILGDLLLVAVLKMNVAGAAIATVAAQAVSVLLSLIIIFKQSRSACSPRPARWRIENSPRRCRKLLQSKSFRCVRRQKLPFRFSMRMIGPNREIGGFVKVGSPLALQSFLTDLTFLALCAFINRLGLDSSSGYGVAQKIVSFVMLIPSALMQSMASIVAQNVGAGREDRAVSFMKCGMLLGSAIGVAVVYVSFFHGDLLARVFTNDAAVVAKAADYLRGFAPDAILTCVMFSFMGYFNGHSQSMFVMAQGLAQSLLVRLPMSYFMSVQPDASLTRIGLAAPAATVFGILLCTVYYFRTARGRTPASN